MPQPPPSPPATPPLPVPVNHTITPALIWPRKSFPKLDLSRSRFINMYGWHLVLQIHFSHLTFELFPPTSIIYYLSVPSIGHLYTEGYSFPKSHLSIFALYVRIQISLEPHRQSRGQQNPPQCINAPALKQKDLMKVCRVYHCSCMTLTPHHCLRTVANTLRARSLSWARTDHHTVSMRPNIFYQFCLCS